MTTTTATTTGLIRSSGRLRPPTTDHGSYLPDGYAEVNDACATWRDHTDRPTPSVHVCRTCGTTTTDPSEHVAWTDTDGTARTAHVPLAISGPSSMSMARATTARADRMAIARATARRDARAKWTTARRLLEAGASATDVRLAVEAAERAETVTTTHGIGSKGDTRGVTVAVDPIARVRVMDADGPTGRPVWPSKRPVGSKVLVGRSKFLAVLAAMTTAMGHTVDLSGTVALGLGATDVRPTRMVGSGGSVPKRAATVTMRGVTYRTEANNGGRLTTATARRAKSTATTTTAKRPARRRITRAELAHRIGSKGDRIG